MDNAALFSIAAEAIDQAASQADLPARCRGISLAKPGLEALRQIHSAWERLA